MKDRVIKFFGVIAVVALLFMASCKEYTEIDYTEVEQEIFDDWMAKYYPGLLNNYQEDGGYYVDLVTVGDTSGRPIMDTVCWVEYDLTGYDLYGNVSITRNDVVAWQQGTYSEYTHYVPYYRYSDPDYDEDESGEISLECTQLALTRALTIGDLSDVVLYDGAEFMLYSPSSIATSTGASGSGGYAGQYSLSTLPFICKVKVTNVVYQPIDYELNIVNAFALANGGLTVTYDSFAAYDEDEDDDDEDDEEEDEEEEEEDNSDPNSWTNSTSTIPFVYLNKRLELNPNGASFNYINPYTSTVPTSAYLNGIDELDKLINTALEKRFSEDYVDDGSLVGDEDSATVWYICRLLDGFIVDTNIAEVKEIIYNDSSATGSSISYSADTDEDSYIAAWYYSIPNMRYGRWSAILTASSYAYGVSGSNGDSVSTAYYDYYGYYSYYNKYSSEYLSYSTSSYSSSSSTASEILPFSPLIFQIYIEAEDED